MWKIKKMSKQKRPLTPSFVLELPLQVSSKDRKTILARMEAGRQLYNACLGEAQRRVRLIRQSKAFQLACAIPRNEAHKAERTKTFRQAREAHQFSDYDLQHYAIGIRSSWLGDHLHTHLTQKLATRAFEAAEKMLFGRTKRLRFKGQDQIPSLEGKSNETGIYYRDGLLLWDGLQLKAMLNPKDQVQHHGLKQRLGATTAPYGPAPRIKYCRMIARKTKAGHQRFFVQLVLEGQPLAAHLRKIDKPNKLPRIPHCSVNGVVGLDLGPSTIAVVAEQAAFLEPFCGELKDQRAQIRRVQRRMDRSKRQSNSNNYEQNGRIKSGSRQWVFSKNYLKDRAYLADLQRREQAYRKNLHGKKINEILRLGNSFKFEKLSYKAWQKRFGKSVGRNAPGYFVQELKRKAVSAGGSILEVSPVQTYLSSRCVCGLRQKKKLSERTHRCSQCGTTMQRDLFSAFLAQHVDSDNLLHADVEKLYSGAKWLLGCAWEQAKAAQARKVPYLRQETASSRSMSGSAASKMQRQSGSSQKVRRTAKNMDVVAGSNASESHKEADASLSKPHG
jgi:putative transposase